MSSSRKQKDRRPPPIAAMPVESLPDSSRRFGMREWLVMGALALLTLAAYWPAGANQFIYFDDQQYIEANPKVWDGLTWSSVKWAFTATAAANWHPITWLSHLLDCQLFGLKPAGHHWMSVGFHAMNVMLVFALLCRMTGAIWRSALVAALFAVHPLRVESVAWVAERKDLLSTLFGLAAIWAYVGFARRRSWWRYALVMAWFALSLMSKPMLVTLPLALLLLDLWPLKRFWTSRPNGGEGAHHAKRADPNPQSKTQNPKWMFLLLEKLPLLALSVGSCIMTFFAQRGGSAIVTFDQLPLKYRLANAAISYVRYLGKTFWPFDLAMLYPYLRRGLLPPFNGWSAEQVYGSVALLLMVTMFAIVLIRKSPWFIVGWLWFLGTLVPTIGLVQVGMQSMADRYTYVPLLGVFIIVAWGAESLARRMYGRAGVIGMASFMVLILLALAIITQKQVRVWSDTVTLFTHTTRAAPGNWRTHFMLGEYLDLQGRPEEALPQFEQAAKINARNDDVQAFLAHTSIRLGRIQAGIAAYRAALQTNPQRLDALNELAWVLATQPDARFRDSKTALQLAQRACQLSNNTHPESLDTLAVAQAENGDFTSALTTATKAREGAAALRRPILVAEIDKHMVGFQDRQPWRAAGLRPRDATK